MRGRLLTALFALSVAYGQITPGRNINMVSGTSFPDGDPFLQRQNEPTIGVSSRNPLHLLAGANDYRAVDLPGLPAGMTADAWLGVFKSLDGGNTWKSTLLPGCPQDIPQCAGSPLKGFQAAADPVVRAGTNGLFYYAGIAFNRGAGGLGTVFVARFIDNNNTETGDPIQYLGTVRVDDGTPTRFIDKPWLATDIPRAGALTCTIGSQRFPGGNVYMAYVSFVGINNEPDETRSTLVLSRSRDCGATWSQPVSITDGGSLAQGASMAVDPNTGTLWVVWRQFASAGRPNAMFVSRSTDGGATFSAPLKIADINPFDQPANTNGLRTNSYPTIAIDGSTPARVYVSWSARGFAQEQDSRVLITSSTDGSNWSAPRLVDTSPMRGHQIMPSMVAAGGRLAILYYDQRETSTSGQLRCPTNNCATISQFVETRPLTGDLASGQTSKVFNAQLFDAAPPSFNPLTDPVSRRQTIDVRLSTASVGANPVFSTVRVSDYSFGNATGGAPGAKPINQLRYNAPNVPLFVSGTRAFIGDYIDLAASPTFLPIQSGTRTIWRFNSSPNTPTIFHAAWTDNRDVIPPKDGDWTKYTPPKIAGASTFSPAQQSPACVADNTGMRNQNIYTSRIAPGLFFGSPNNNKPLSPTLQRNFILFLQNTTNSVKYFRLSLPSTSLPGGTVSFITGASLGQLDVAVAPRSSVTRSVFATSSDPRTRITVNVQEVTGVGGAPVPGGLTSSTVLNNDNSSPTLESSGIPGTPNIGQAEVFNPDLTNPDLTNPDLTNPDLTNPDLTNPDLTNPDLTNPDLTNPGAANPDLTNPVISNPDLTNPDLTNPDLTNNVLTDATYRVTNKGNTVAPYTIRLVRRTEVPAGFKLQLIVYKVYTNPAAKGCTLSQTTQNQLVANIPNPKLIPITGQNPDLTNPDLTNPDLTNPDLTNATLYLEPGQQARVTLRILAPTKAAATTFVETNVSPTVVSQAPNTGQTGPPPATILIANAALPEGFKNTSYSATLNAIGGVGAKTWSVTGTLPAGLSLNAATGQISGTPTAGAQSLVTFTVRDSSTPTPLTASRTFVISIGDTFAITSPAMLPGLKRTVPPPYTLTAAGGIPPFRWSFVSGSLPTGLSLTQSGAFSGTPQAEGTFVFTARVVDSATVNPQSAQQTFSVTVGPAPLLLSVLQASGVQGRTVPVAILGSGTGFVQGQSVIAGGVGITATNVQVQSPTSLTADLVIPPNEPLGFADIRVTTGAEVVVRGKIYNVLARPILLGVTPIGAARSQSLSVDITGAGTNFQSGTPQIAFSGTGVTVQSLQAISRTLLRANILVGAGAELTTRSITYTNPGENDTLSNVFVVADVIGNVQGQVFDSNGSSVSPGAYLRLYRNGLPVGVAFANILGAFNFNGLPGGAYTLYAVSAANTLFGSASFTISASGVTVTQNLILGATGNVTVNVRDRNNAVVPNATVYLQPVTSAPAEFTSTILALRTGTTDANGSAVFPGVPSGDIQAVAVDSTITRGGSAAGVLGSALTLNLTLDPAESYSRAVSVYNGPPIDANALPAGSNEVLSRTVSVYNGPTPDPNGLPAGLNETYSKTVSVQYAPTLSGGSTSVGINFGSAAGLVTGTAGVGEFAQAYWNNVDLNSGSLSGLKTNLNETSGMTVSWNASGSTLINEVQNTTENNRLMRGFLDVVSPATGTVTVTGIPYSSYRVIVYFDGANQAESQVMSFTIGSQTVYARDSAGTDFNGSFVQVVNSTTNQGNNTPAGNYAIFSNVTGSSFTLSATGVFTSGTFTRARINAIQIVSATQVFNGRTATTVTNDTFDSNVSSGWSTTGTSFVTIAGFNRRYLGPFGTNGVTHSTATLPSHTSLRVTFDIYILGTWAGNEGVQPHAFRYAIDGKTLVNTTFRNLSGGTQSYPYNLPGGGQAPLTGNFQVDGFFQGTAGISVYRLSHTVPHSAATATLSFTGSGLDSITSQAWGLDNVKIEALGPSPLTPGHLLSSSPMGGTSVLTAWDPQTRLSASSSLSIPCSSTGQAVVDDSHVISVPCRFSAPLGSAAAGQEGLLEVLGGSTLFSNPSQVPFLSGATQVLKNNPGEYYLGINETLFYFGFGTLFPRASYPGLISGLAADPAKRLYVAHRLPSGAGRIMRSPTFDGGFESNFADIATGGAVGVGVDDEGSVYTFNPNTNEVMKFRQRRPSDPTGTTTGILAATVSRPLSAAPTYNPATGLLYQYGNGRMYVFDKNLNVVDAPIVNVGSMTPAVIP